jgi:hypothetical protein
MLQAAGALASFAAVRGAEPGEDGTIPKICLELSRRLQA